MIYVWKAASYLKADAQDIGETLEKTRVKNGGLLTPQLVVRAAKPKKSPLHECFEWNDVKAAELYREDRARYVLRHIAVVYADEAAGEQRTVRAFISIKDDGERIYQSTLVAMQSVDLRQQILDRALRELEQFRGRYHEFEELVGVFAAMDEMAA